MPLPRPGQRPAHRPVNPSGEGDHLRNIRPTLDEGPGLSSRRPPLAGQRGRVLPAPCGPGPVATRLVSGPPLLEATFMCGIVAFTGGREAGPILLDGLRRLE